MHNRKISGVLRSVSVLIIFLVVFLWFTLNTLIDDALPEIGDTGFGKEYEYKNSPAGVSIPGFTNNLELLFLKPLVRRVISERVETEIAAESVTPVAAPSLQFIGMIETAKAKVYSFRNMDTNRLLFLEEGTSADGFTLLMIAKSAKGTVFTIKKQGHTFQVRKK